jgi:translocation and assembly module TamA
MLPARPDQPSAMAPYRTRILAQIAAAVFTLLTVSGVQAQGIDYRVQIDAPAPLEELLENNLDLVRWRGNARLDRDQLQRLVRHAPEQVRTLVATEGYYSPTVSAGLDTQDEELVARVIVEAGQPTLVGDIDLVLKGFEPLAAGARPFNAEALRSRWALPVGRIFRQQDWELAKRTLLRQVMQTRYPRAQLAESSATVDPELRTALLRVVLDSGPEAQFGGLRIEGLKRYPQAIIDNLNTIKPQDEYSEAALQAFQARLQDTGYFSSVEVSADMGAALDEQIVDIAKDKKPAAAAGPDLLPVLVRVTENKQRNTSVGLGFSTNTGYRAQVSYDDLNVRGLRMKSNIVLETKRQTARADFYFPTRPSGRNDSFGGGIERTDLNGEVTSVTTLAAKRQWGSPLLERSVGIEYLAETRSVDGLAQTSSKSVPITYSLTRRAIDNLLLPSRGYVVNATLGGALLPLLTDERFIRASARGIYYKPLNPASTLVLRAELGILASRQKAGVPGSFLFRAGGDQSVRGYGYQELGVQEGTAIVGGRYLATGSVEYQHWFKPAWGAAVFLDAGNAADKINELHPKSGYGVGARWRSPVGPINVDLAYGHASEKARLHFSLGFTF